MHQKNMEENIMKIIYHQLLWLESLHIWIHFQIRLHRCPVFSEFVWSSWASIYVTSSLMLSSEMLWKNKNSESPTRIWERRYAPNFFLPHCQTNPWWRRRICLAQYLNNKTIIAFSSTSIIESMHPNPLVHSAKW